MKITETTKIVTPPPRTFTLEFTEDELRILGIIMGNMYSGQEIDYLNNGSHYIPSPIDPHKLITKDFYHQIREVYNR